MEWITEKDLENISVGATLLGTGGGGDPFVGKLMAMQAIQKYGPVKVLQLDELDDEELVMPVGSIGAPSVSNEKIASEEEIYAPAEALKEFFRKERKRLCLLKLEEETHYCQLPVQLRWVCQLLMLMRWGELFLSPKW